MPWALSDIRRKVRQVTGRLSSNQLGTNQLDEYINNYYQFTFPAETKLEREHTFYEFETSPNTQEYTFPSGYTNFEPPVYLDMMPLLYYQDPTVYFQENPTQVTRLTPWTGDGVTVVFSTTIQQPPIIAGTVIVTDNTEVFNDDGNGVLTGSLGGIGSVNYTTGAISVTFNTAPVSSQNIYLSFGGYVAGAPTAVLLYNNVFTFYPIPDTVYRVMVKAYAIPSPLVDATDTPVLEEWGEALAYGAARDICIDFGETERYSEITQLYKEQIAYIMTRTHQNLLNERTRPMW
jgi:hypothetical protein